MKLTFHYLYTLILTLLSMVGISSCVDLDGADTGALNSPPMGTSSNAYKELTLVIPGNQVLENPFEIINVYYGNDYEKDCMQIFCYTISDELPIPSMTSFALFLEVPDLNKLKAGQSLSIYRSELSWSLSSNLGDYQSYIPNGASVIVREANDEYIDLYVDHLKFFFSSSFYLKDGDYTVFGDIKFPRVIINAVQE